MLRMINMLWVLIALVSIGACTDSRVKQSVDEQISESDETLDLVDGFYQIFQGKTWRKLHLRGKTYYVTGPPIVTNSELIKIRTIGNWRSEFVYNKTGAKKLLLYTSEHPGKRLGLVQNGKLKAIYEIEGMVHDGVIVIYWNPDSYKFRLLGATLRLNRMNYESCLMETTINFFS